MFAGDNFEVIYGAKLQTCDLTESKAKLITEDGTVIHSGLVIGADGANSQVRKAMKDASYTFKDYHQFGVVGTVSLEESESRHDIAFQKFMPTGVLNKKV